MQRGEAVGRHSVRGGEAVCFADHDAVERLERGVRRPDGVEDVAAAIGGAHDRGQALLVVRRSGARLFGEELAQRGCVVGVDELEDRGQHGYH